MHVFAVHRCLLVHIQRSISHGIDVSFCQTGRDDMDSIQHHITPAIRLYITMSQKEITPTKAALRTLYPA